MFCFVIKHFYVVLLLTLTMINNECLGVNIVDVFIKSMIVWVGILEGLSCDNLPLARAEWLSHAMGLVVTKFTSNKYTMTYDA